MTWTCRAAEKADRPGDYANTSHLFAKVPEPPKTPSISAKDTYVIDGKEFGITEGFLKRGKRVIDGKEIVCYSDEDYRVAHNNVLGLNRAIDFGAKQGAKKILLPKGEYSFCYASIDVDPKQNCVVIDHDNLVVDFNGSTWKAIYDSNRRSPYDRVQPHWRENVWVANTKKPPFHFGGFFLMVSDCQNTTLRNGTVIGDKADRAFVEQAEKSRENTYGVGAGGNCQNVVVENFDVSSFMGDGLTGSKGFRNKGVMEGYRMGWKPGGLTKAGAKTRAGDKQTSDFIPVEAGASYFMQGYGYTQGMTALAKRAYEVFAYNAEQNFLGALGTVPVLRAFTAPEGAAFVRLVVDEKKVNKDGWQMILHRGTYGSHVTFRDNYVHHNHRGGMTIGVNDMLIIRNRFYNNGECPDEENNLPGFEQASGNPFMTRYHINMEDSQGHNIHILKNTFENGYLGIAVRGSEYWVEDNTFVNCDAVFYRLLNLVMKNNTFRNGGLGTFPYNHDGWFERNWIIDGNQINGRVTIAGDAPLRSFINNTVTEGFRSDARIASFRGNTFQLNRDNGFSPLVTLATIDVIEKCRFVKDVDCKAKNVINIGVVPTKGKKSVAAKATGRVEVRDCVFERIKMDATRTDYIGCTFTDAGLTMSTDLSFVDCTFEQGDYTLLNNYAGRPDNTAVFFVNKGAELSLKGCSIAANGPHPIFASMNNEALPVDADFQKTTIVQKGSGRVGLSVLGGTVTLTDSSITSRKRLTPMKRTPKLVRSKIRIGRR